MNMPERRRSTNIRDVLASLPTSEMSLLIKLKRSCLEMTALECCPDRKMEKESFINEF